MTDSQILSYENAEALRKSKNYLQALEQFTQIWQRNPSPFVGWRYAFCLRKVGKLEDAESVARQALRKYPEDKFTKSELGWILYEKELKPAKEEDDLGRAVHVANQILELNSDGIVLAKTALAVIKVAKNRKNWEVLLEWSNRLTPENLDSRPMMFDGKRGMSDRETWYVSRARALLELEHFDEARQFAQAGLIEFPDEIFLRRTAALSLARSGNLPDGIAEMRAILTHRRAAWYMKAELSELEYQAGNYSEAYRLICDALSTSRQSEEYKLGYFVTLARIALSLGKLETAAEHTMLAKVIRSRKGWKIPSDLVKIEKDILAALQASNKEWPELPQDTQQLGKLCRRRWQSGKDDGVQFYRGTVKPYPKGRYFAFIRRDDGGEDVYVAVRDLPGNCNQPGSRVKFALRMSYDKKKERETVRATNIRCFNG